MDDKVRVPLRNGLSINLSGPVTIQEIEGFALSSLNDHKYGNPEPRVDVSMFVHAPDRQIKSFELALGGVDHTQQECVQSLGEAHSVANTLKQMLEELPQWKQEAERDGGTLQDVVALLEQKRHAEAFALMMTGYLQKMNA